MTDEEKFRELAADNWDNINEPEEALAAVQWAASEIDRLRARIAELERGGTGMVQ